ncbi:MAG: PQQ-dependent sugar dehydrogenase, partial [Anaerolineales bacterium]|nr:PQQ-dependent sugar dehydrogenase [Anaerolineales bacterium]
WGTTFATGLAQPTSIKNDGTDRLYVTEREGTIRIIEADGTLLSNLFLDISDEVNANFTEQGLLGLAFHPDYAGNGRFYLTYTNQSGDV